MKSKYHPLDKVTEMIPAFPQHTATLKRFQHFSTKVFGGLLTTAITLGAVLAEPGISAERIILRVGPFERSIEVNDLEQFAESGDVPRSLRLYAPLLTPQVRDSLNKKLQVDPDLGDKFLDELLASRDGKQLLAHLRLALPEVQVEELRAVLYLALRQGDGLNAISILRAFPGRTITIDASAAASLILQFNSSYLQSRILSPVLEEELKSPSEQFFSPGFDPGLKGEQTVSKRTFILRDRDRRRTIPVDFYYGTEVEAPLIVLSHGFASDRRFLVYIAEHLASYGFSVASIEHPGSNVQSLAQVSLSLKPGDIISPSEFIERPRDITFLLNELERLRREQDFLKDKFSTREVTVIGHSLGGYTALALAGGELDLSELRRFCANLTPLGRSPADWLQCAAADLPEDKVNLQDERVVQAIALNPVIGKLFGNNGLAQIEIPIAILSGSDDAISPALDHQLRPFRQLRGEKYLLSVIGGTHLSVTDFAHLNQDTKYHTLVEERLGVETEPLRHWLRGFSLSLVQQLTPEAQKYQPFLSSGYAQFLSPPTSDSDPTLQLRFTKEISSTTNVWLQVVSAGAQRLALRPSREKTPFLLTIDHYLENAKRIIAPREFSRGELNQIFSNLLSNNSKLSG